MDRPEERPPFGNPEGNPEKAPIDSPRKGRLQRAFGSIAQSLAHMREVGAERLGHLPKPKYTLDATDGAEKYGEAGDAEYERSPLIAELLDVAKDANKLLVFALEEYAQLPQDPEHPLRPLVPVHFYDEDGAEALQWNMFMRLGGPNYRDTIIPYADLQNYTNRQLATLKAQLPGAGATLETPLYDMHVIISAKLDSSPEGRRSDGSYPITRVDSRVIANELFSPMQFHPSETHTRARQIDFMIGSNGQVQRLMVDDVRYVDSSDHPAQRRTGVNTRQIADQLLSALDDTHHAYKSIRSIDAAPDA